MAAIKKAAAAKVSKVFKRGYGWMADLPDQRDFMYLANRHLSSDFWTIRR